MSCCNSENIFGLNESEQALVLNDNLDANNYKVINLANGTNNQDAINKQQLDAAILGIYPINEISDGGVPETKVNTNDFAQQITFTAGGSEVMTMKNNGFIIREDVNLQSNNIQTSHVPVSANDLTNKTYVDDQIDAADHIRDSDNTTSVQVVEAFEDVRVTCNNQLTMTFRDTSITADVPINAQTNYVRTSFTPTINTDLTNKLYVDTQDSGLQTQIDSNDTDILNLQNRTLDQVPLAVADVDLNTNKITNVVDPTLNQDAATKNYVDNAVSSLSQNKIENLDDQSTSVTCENSEEIKYVCNNNEIMRHVQNGTHFLYPIRLYDNSNTTQYGSLDFSSGQVGLTVLDNGPLITMRNGATSTDDNFLLSIQNQKTSYSGTAPLTSQLSCSHADAAFNSEQQCNFGLFYNTNLFGSGYSANAGGMLNIINSVTNPAFPFMISHFDLNGFTLTKYLVMNDSLYSNHNVSYQKLRYDDESTKTFDNDSDIVSKKYVDDSISGGTTDRIIFTGDGSRLVIKLGQELEMTDTANLHSFVIGYLPSTTTYRINTADPLEIQSAGGILMKYNTSNAMLFDSSYTYQYRQLVSSGNNIGFGFDTGATRWLDVRQNIVSAGNEYLQFIKDTGGSPVEIATVNRNTSRFHFNLLPFAGPQAYITPSLDYELIQKKYVDDEISGINTIANGTSSVSIPVSNGSISMSVSGNKLQVNSSDIDVLADVNMYNDFILPNDTFNFKNSSSGTIMTVNDTGHIMYKELSMNTSNKITDLADPTLDQDAATKKYVDDELAAYTTNIIESADTTNNIECTNTDVQVYTNSISKVQINDTTTNFTHDITTSVDQTSVAPSDQNYVTKKYADANYSGGGGSIGYMSILVPSQGAANWNASTFTVESTNLSSGVDYNLINSTTDANAGIEFLVAGIYEFNVYAKVNSGSIISTTIFKNSVQIGNAVTISNDASTAIQSVNFVMSSLSANDLIRFRDGFVNTNIGSITVKRW